MLGKINMMPEDRVRTEPDINTRWQIMWVAWMDGDRNGVEGHGFTESEALENLHELLEPKGIIYLTPDNSSGSYLLMQQAIPPQPRGGCYAG